MKLIFNDDLGYESFQLMWIALSKTTHPVTTIRTIMTAHTLITKMSALSHDMPNGARVLTRECEMEITTDEQILLLDAFATTPWAPKMFPFVRRACRFLGAEFEEDGPKHITLH